MLTSFFMVDDIYKAFFREFGWTPGVEDYLAATAGIVVQELTRRGLALHYVVDATQPEDNLAAMLELHQEHRSSAYINFDLDDGLPGLNLDVALSQRGAPGTIVVFRNQPPAEGSVAILFPPPGVQLPDEGQLSRNR